MEKVNVFWFRRDLRLHDNAGLHHALQSGRDVLPIFIFDTSILSQLENTYDRRVDYIHQSLNQLQAALIRHRSSLVTFVGTAREAFEKLLAVYPIAAVYCNHDYEPNAIKRDQEVADLLAERDIRFLDYKDQVIFERDEVLKADGTPYTVYTPYANKWKAMLRPADYRELSMDKSRFIAHPPTDIPSLADIGFEKTDMLLTPPALDAHVIANYGKYRNFPASDGTTQIGIALRFGTISIRRCVAFAREHEHIWLNQLIWREFFMQILYHFPTVVDHCFKPRYENIAWRNDEEEFRRWCAGETGYPIVDAGMRQLNETGQLHNRVRMVAASFLVKHLLVDWRWGEAYFAGRLLDYDLAANNGNWQWVAGCGCDAAPYFRVFNPDEQVRKFDSELRYVRRWNPDFEKDLMQYRIVEHRFARDRALRTYKAALSS